MTVYISECTSILIYFASRTVRGILVYFIAVHKWQQLLRTDWGMWICMVNFERHVSSKFFKAQWCVCKIRGTPVAHNLTY